MQLPYRKPGKYSQIPQDLVMSQEKLDALKARLESLKAQRPSAAQDVARLAEMGDFSENVEYQLAKRRLRGINHHILKLEYEIEHASVIARPKEGSVVALGHTVSILSSDGKQKSYQILGSSESDPGRGVISHLSPIGSALLGCRLGEEVVVQVGGKDVVYTVVRID